MSPSLDLLILPLSRVGEQEQLAVPGLYVAGPPRRPARGRDRDQLILHLALTGNAPLTPQQMDQMLEGLAKVYYRTSGTVTAALRSVAELVNEYLLERNLRNTNTGSQAIGLLTLAVLRDDRLSLAQSGPVHAYLISTNGAQHFHDPQLAGRGLGLTRTPAIRYFQVDLQANDALVLTPQPPIAWTLAALQSAQNQGPEGLRRRLLSQAGEDLNAVLFQAQPGNGQLRLLRPARPAKATSPAVAPGRPEQANIPRAATPTRLAPSAPPPPTPDESPAARPPTGAPTPQAQEKQSTVASLPARPSRPVRRPSLNLAPLLGPLGALGSAVAGALGRILRGAAALLVRMLPDEGLFTLPASTMAFIAIAVPLLVVTVSSMVYFQRGRAAQHQVYLEQAQQSAAQAQGQSDPGALRQSWNETLNRLDMAEQYGSSAGSKNLRTMAQGELDALDYVERLDFQPALVDDLKETANITRMLATDTDLYMLNAREGVVLRATLTSNGYRLDPTFQCGPGPYGGYIVGAITDIAALPKGNEMNATLLGIDANGNLLFCLPGDAPLAVPLVPPDINWGTPQGLAYDTEDLYILDPQANAVWIYRRMEFDEQPRLFFGQQIPPMEDVIDMAVNLDDLYLLHTNGHMTTCVFSGLIESPTRCEEPAVYSDPRPGRQSGPLIEGAYFTEILFVSPPDPSLYLLEPNSQAVYHFSLRLTFHRQYRPAEPLSGGPATAFAISRGNHTLFLAVGNQVFYAALP